MVYLFVGILLFVHFFVLQYIASGLAQSTRQTITPTDKIDLTVIIPLRNEEKNVPFLINSLSGQDISKHHVKFLFIDDHSTDNTLELLRQQLHTFPFQYQVLNQNDENTFGKKQAIKQGVYHTQSEYVVQTDADCIHPPNWLSSIQNRLALTHPDLLILPVYLNKSSTLLLDYYDFFALQFLTFGLAGNNLPILCNGANMAFKTSKFKDVTIRHEKISSGDDIFLLETLVQQKSRIEAFQHASVVAETNGSKSLGLFIKQRVRWASKNKYSTNRFNKKIGLYFLLVNLLPLIIIYYSPLLSLLLVAIKSTIEFIYLKKKAHHQNQPFHFFEFLTVNTIYPFYLISIISASLFWKPDWKKRKIEV